MASIGIRRDRETLFSEVIHIMRFSVALLNDFPQELVRGINAAIQGRNDDWDAGYRLGRVGWA
jgi:hypothetical protein